MQVWTEIESPLILKEISSRLSELKKLSFARLKELPEISSDSTRIGESEVTFTTYRDIEENGNLEIVVQASVKQGDGVILKHKQVSADGFGVSSDGEVHVLSKDTLYFYM